MSYDWNGNGHHDSGDDFIGFNIYKDVTGDGKNSGSGSGNGGCAKWVIIAIVLIFLSFFYR